MDPESAPLVDDNQLEQSLRRKLTSLKYQRIALLLVFVLAVAAIIALSVLYTGALSQNTNVYHRYNTTSSFPGLSAYNSLFQSTRGVWRENRLRLMSLLRTQPGYTPGYVVLKGAEHLLRNGDVDFSFRQQNDFLYVSGIDFASAWMVLDPTTGNSTAFVPQLQPNDGIWFGQIKTPAEIAALYDLDNVMYTTGLNDFLLATVPTTTTLYVLNTDTSLTQWRNQIPNITDYQLDGTKLFNALQVSRAVKSDKEVAIMAYVANISSEAHLMLWRTTQPGVREFQLAGLFEGHCEMNGLPYQAYPPIVGSGYNSAVLHYMTNQAIVPNNSFVLVDAGGELWNYATDITRTFPSTGTYTDQQRIVYQMVYDVQTKTVELVKEGVSFEQLIANATRFLLEELLANNFLQGNLPDLITSGVNRVFMPHGLGHFVGMDVHDTPTLPKNTTLTAGMIITIEPGIYFNEESMALGLNSTTQGIYLNAQKIAEYDGIGGVRIEDTILVTATGHQVLSQGLPKRIDEIEAYMANARAQD